MRLLCSLLALPAALVLLAGCGGSPDRALTLEGLAQAATTSSRASTGRFTFSMDMTAPDGYETISFSGYGAFDAQAGKSQLSLDLSSFASLLSALAPSTGDAPDFANPELWKVEAVLDGLDMYMRFPLLARIPDSPLEGKSWVKIDLRRAADVAGLDLDQLMQFTSNDPRESLRLLEAVSGGLEELGEEEVHGVNTTHYRTNVDLRKYGQLVPASERERVGSMLDALVAQSGLRTIPVEVWVDEQSLVHRLTMTLSSTQPGTGQSFDSSVRFELYGYGEPVAIALPPRAATFDVTALVGG
jgi:hypothetical protein